MIKINNIFGIMILDSRGYPTLEVTVGFSDGSVGVASVPSGASVGSAEALELRDGGAKWGGKGVDRALMNVNVVIAGRLQSKELMSLEELDAFLCELDGTPHKSVLGANAILAVSLAYAKALAKHHRLPLHEFLGTGTLMPTPLFNIVNGGMHADNELDFQEFMIVPSGIVSFEEKLRAGSEIFHSLKKRLHHEGLSTAVGDEGGFAPRISTAFQALELVVDAIDDAGYCPGRDITIALDVAATEFHADGHYVLRGENGAKLTSKELCNYITDLCKKYPISSVEDPMAEQDYNGWKQITQQIGRNTQIVGDDVFVTNINLFNHGIAQGIANAILIKPNQIGTLSETLNTIRRAQEVGYQVVVSHRSGETEDTTIAHIAVGMNCGQIKAGSLSRSERLCKYNELLRIHNSQLKK
jgi:enolase